MLQLLPSGLRLLPKHIFFATLFGISIFGHALLLLSIFFIGWSDQSIIINTLQENQAAVVLVPLFKQIPASFSPKLSANTLPSSKIATPKPKTDTPKPEAIKKEEPPKQSSSSPKPLSPSSTSATFIESAETKKPNSQPKKAAPPKVIPQKNISQKTEKNQPTDVLKKEAPVSKSSDELDKKLLAHNSTSLFSSEALAQETTYVGRDEFARLRLIEEIKIGIAQQWQRPTGMPLHLQCHVRIILDSSGNKKISLAKSSGACAYDICAQQALMRYQFPEEARNQEILLIM